MIVNIVGDIRVDIEIINKVGDISKFIKIVIVNIVNKI